MLSKLKFVNLHDARCNVVCDYSSWCYKITFSHMGRGLAGSCLRMSNDTKTRGGNGKSRPGSKDEPWSIVFSDVSFCCVSVCVFASTVFVSYHIALMSSSEVRWSILDCYDMFQLKNGESSLQSGLPSQV